MIRVLPNDEYNKEETQLDALLGDSGIDDAFAVLTDGARTDRYYVVTSFLGEGNFGTYDFIALCKHLLGDGFEITDLENYT